LNNTITSSYYGINFNCPNAANNNNLIRGNTLDRGGYSYDDGNAGMQLICGSGNTILEIQLNASDADNDTLTFLTDAGSVLHSPLWINQATKNSTWTPWYNDSGTYNVTFTATDGMAQDNETVQITVIDVVRPPLRRPIIPNT